MSEGLQDIQSQKGGKLHLPFSVVSCVLYGSIYRLSLPDGQETTEKGSGPSPYLFNIVMDLLKKEMRERAPGTMLLPDCILLEDEHRAGVVKKMVKLGRAVEDGGLRMGRMKTQYMCFGREENIGDGNLLG
ncbi:hypothetical protein AAG570_010647 [Ranatra chinensis]|uniref:Reverse transcriptase domain-containing protein n=1 Tax=Ranatra chinensis TaxID=642074 RepID=A0ABD0YN48_9HEMI